MCIPGARDREGTMMRKESAVLRPKSQNFKLGEANVLSWAICIALELQEMEAELSLSP